MNVLRAMCTKDMVALYILYQVVNESSFEKIVNAKSSKEVWNIMGKAYKGDN